MKKIKGKNIFVAAIFLGGLFLVQSAHATTFIPQDDTIFNSGNYDLIPSTYVHIATTTPIATTTLFFTFSVNSYSTSGAGGQVSVHGQTCGQGFNFYSIYPIGSIPGNDSTPHSDLLWCTNEITAMNSSTIAGNLQQEYYATATVGFASGDSLWFRGSNAGYLSHTIPGTINIGSNTWLAGNGWGGICDAASFNPTTGCASGGGGGGGSLSGSFAAPSNGMVIPDFSNWVVDLNAPTGTTIYAQVQYQFGNQWTLVRHIYNDTLSVALGNQTSTRIQIPKTNPLLQLSGLDSQNSQWIAELYLSTSTNFLVPSSSESIFTITPFATSTPIGTSTALTGPWIYNGVQQNPSVAPETLQSSTAFLYSQCPAPSGITDIGGGISFAFCTALNQMFVPGPVGTALLSNDVAAIEAVPPYAWFFQTNSIIETAAAATTSTATGLVLANFDAGFGRTSTVALLVPDPTTDPRLNAHTAFGPHTLIELLWNLVLVGFIILIIYSIYKIIF